MRKAKVTFDNSELRAKGAYVSSQSTYHWDGPGWYALQEDTFEWIKVSSHSKEQGFTVEEAERGDYAGSPAYIETFAELQAD